MLTIIQYIDFPTHIRVNILDLVITPYEYKLKSNHLEEHYSPINISSILRYHYTIQK